MAYTVGELYDAYTGWIWREERKRQELAYQTRAILMGQGHKLTLSQVMGRAPYPQLRSLQTSPTNVDDTGELLDSRSHEEKVEELNELKDIFSDIKIGGDGTFHRKQGDPGDK